MTTIDLILQEKALIFKESLLVSPQAFEVEYMYGYNGEGLYRYIGIEKNIEDLIKALKSRFGINNISTWSIAYKFLDNAECFFKSNEDSMISYQNAIFIKEHLSKIIFEVPKEYCYYESLTNLLVEATFDSAFFTGFLNASFDREIPVDIIYSQLQRLDIENYHSHFGLVRCAAFKNPEKAKEIIELYLKETDLTFFIYFDALLCGIVEKLEGDSFTTIAKLNDREIYQQLIIHSIGFIKSNSLLVLTEALDIIDNCKNIEANFLQKVLTLVKVSQIPDCPTEILSRCKKALIDLSLSESPNIQYTVLNLLNEASFDEETKVEIIAECITNPKFCKDFLKPNGNNVRVLDSTIRDNVKNINNFFNLLKSFGSSYHFETEYFEGSIKEMAYIDFSKLLNCVIDLLTDYKANSRFIGYKLINFISREYPNYKNTDKVCDISEEKKIILYLSVMIPIYINFSLVFRLIIPLFSIEVAYFRNFILAGLINKFTYHIEILETIQNEMENGDIKDQIINILSSLKEEYHFSEERKISLNEFSPYSTQYSHLQTYNKFFKESLNQQFEKAQENSLITKLRIPKTVLLKGGGVKYEGEKITKLSRIESKVVVPKGLFINPEEDNMRTSMYFSEDWNSIEDWKGWLTKL